MSQVGRLYMYQYAIFLLRSLRSVRQMRKRYIGPEKSMPLGSKCLVVRCYFDLDNLVLLVV